VARSGLSRLTFNVTASTLGFDLASNSVRENYRHQQRRRCGDKGDASSYWQASKTPTPS
jgi:hypothetical protein